MNIAARHVKRLAIMLKRLDNQEKIMQVYVGNRVAGSSRSSDWRDAEALRAALVAIQPCRPASVSSTDAPT